MSAYYPLFTAVGILGAVAISVAVLGWLFKVSLLDSCEKDSKEDMY